MQDIGAHAGSAGYYTIDECRSELIPGAFSQYARLRQLDPDSMTFAALFGNLDIALWRDAADVRSSDPYPKYAAEPSGGYNHKQVADWTAQTREAVKDARPFLTVLQFFKFTSQGRWPTRQEMRNHAYMAIVEGAKGLWWWSIGNGNGALASLCSNWCAERAAHMDDLKAVVGELAELEPVLLTDDTPGALTGNSNPTAIHTKVKVINGKGYVFASNSSNQNVTATLTWNTPPDTVTVNAEGRTLAPSGNSFSDTFEPYQAHVYIIDNTGPPVASPALTVSATASSAASAAAASAAAATGITVTGGDSVTVTLTNGHGGATDWLALAPTGAPDSTYLQWDYVGAGVTTRTWTVSMPDTAGAYEFRLLLNDASFGPPPAPR